MRNLRLDGNAVLGPVKSAIHTDKEGDRELEIIVMASIVMGNDDLDWLVVSKDAANAIGLLFWNSDDEGLARHGGVNQISLPGVFHDQALQLRQGRSQVELEQGCSAGAWRLAPQDGRSFLCTFRLTIPGTDATWRFMRAALTAGSCHIKSLESRQSDIEDMGA